MAAKPRSADPPATGRRQAHAEMLRQALARPGVRDAMRVYAHWHKADQGLAPGRAAARMTPKIVTTNASRTD